MKRLALLLLAACGADVPAEPTWFRDVQPILRANCARCHGADPVDIKIAGFRLDRYVKNDPSTHDAYDYSVGMDPAMTRVAVDLDTPAMPPDYTLTERQREILARWVAAGAPKGTRDNHLPGIELISPQGTTTADQTIDAVFRAWDDDLDGLVVQLWARDTNGDTFPIGAQTGGGTRALAIDSGTLASKHMFEIYAVIDDGFHDDPALNKEHHVTLIPEVFVDHGARGTAPTVKLLEPNGGDTKIGGIAIAWSATDPDVDADGAPDTLTIGLALVRFAPDGAELSAEPIANNLPNTGTYAWMIPSGLATRDASGPIPYKVRITAEDSLGAPHNLRSDESDFVFFIEQAVTTSYTWTDVFPVFDKYCKKCHGAVGSTPAIDDSCLLQYQKGENTSLCEPTDLGAYELRSTIFSKMVTAKTMPPAAEPQPSQADIDKVASWIQGGAPYGTGPVDARPSLTWIAPSNNAQLTSSGGTAMLHWSVSDDMGLASDKIQYAKFAATGPNCTVNCQTMTSMIAESVWTSHEVTTGTLTGTAQDRTLTWTAPEGAGCYCVRGTVTDSAGQSTTVTAGKAVRF